MCFHSEEPVLGQCAGIFQLMRRKVQKPCEHVMGTWMDPYQFINLCNHRSPLCASAYLYLEKTVISTKSPQKEDDRFGPVKL